MAFALILASTAHAIAHSGGTNSDGCHNNHKTGGYHCH
ncbi:MAG: YHYH domain-containing protein [Alphaproteobacteria bacterium]